MLEKQAWMKLAPDMITAWRQSMEEGRDAAAFETECRELAKRSETEDCEKEAAALYGEMMNAPMREGYPYEEPSGWDGIQSLVRGTPAVDWRESLSGEKLKDKLAGAWTGRIAGCLLGKPFEGLHTPDIRRVQEADENVPLSRYARSEGFTGELEEKFGDRCWIDRISGAAPVDDDTNYTVLSLRLVDEYGADFRPGDVLEAWLSWMPMFAACTAERAAYRNAAMGLYPPETAVRLNPFREWIGAQIRGDFFGYICPGDTKRAADMAWRDASISHVKNGIYGEMWVSAMLARAAVSGDIEDIIEAGLSEIPPKSRLAEEVGRVIGWYRYGVPAEKVFENIHTAYDEYDPHDWCHTISNAMIVAACLLYGEKDFGKTICMAVETGFDTDCNAATSGSVLGMVLGERAVPACWGDSFYRKLKTSIEGYNEVSVDDLAEKTYELLLRSER